MDEHRENEALVFRFEIGEGFPASDKVAQLVLRLALPTNDLLFLAPYFEAALESEGEHQGGRQIYWFRLIGGHLREALKILAEARREPDFAAFLAKLPSEAQELMAQLETYYEPWDGSYVQQNLKPLRDGVFHYLDTTAIARAITAIAREKSEIIIERPTMRVVVADDVVADHWVREIEATGNSFFEAIAQSRLLRELFLKLMQYVLLTYTAEAIEPIAEVTNEPATLGRDKSTDSD